MRSSLGRGTLCGGNATVCIFGAKRENALRIGFGRVIASEFHAQESQMGPTAMSAAYFWAV